MPWPRWNNQQFAIANAIQWWHSSVHGSLGTVEAGPRGRRSSAWRLMLLARAPRFVGRLGNPSVWPWAATRLQTFRSSLLVLEFLPAPQRKRWDDAVSSTWPHFILPFTWRGAAIQVDSPKKHLQSSDIQISHSNCSSYHKSKFNYFNPVLPYKLRHFSIYIKPTGGRSYNKGSFYEYK